MSRRYGRNYEAVVDLMCKNAKAAIISDLRPKLRRFP